MIGSVIDLEARICVEIASLQGTFAQHEFVIDSGFEGALTLPQSIIDELGLEFAMTTGATLADSTSVQTRAYKAKIRWMGSEFRVAVLTMEGRQLLGTSLLEGHRLAIDFTERGPVEITPLSSSSPNT